MALPLFDDEADIAVIGSSFSGAALIAVHLVQAAKQDGLAIRRYRQFLGWIYQLTLIDRLDDERCHHDRQLRRVLLEIA